MSTPRKLSPEELATELHITADRAPHATAHIRAHITALEAELARLTPSGQVAEDEAWVEAAVENRLMQYWMAHPDYNRSVMEPRRRADAALSRLAAQAQGYEAMKAEWDEVVRWLGDVTEALLGERPVGAMPGTTVDAARALRAENERVLRLASDACAKSERVGAERDAAVANNAAKDKAMAPIVEAVRAVFEAHHAPSHCALGLNLRVADGETLLAAAHSHPGAALLAEHAAALVRARNEGREEAAQVVDDAGPRFGEIAESIRAKKEPEL